MGVHARKTAYMAAAVAIGGMVATALTGAEIRIHMVVCILALLAGLTAVAALFTGPNERLLAEARVKLAAMQVNRTMEERARDHRSDGDDDTPPHPWFRRSA